VEEMAAELKTLRERADSQQKRAEFQQERTETQQERIDLAARDSPKSAPVSKPRRTRSESRSDTRRALAIRRSKTLALDAFRVANKALAVLPKAV
jgi:hypothetical protein